MLLLLLNKYRYSLSRLNSSCVTLSNKMASAAVALLISLFNSDVSAIVLVRISWAWVASKLLIKSIIPFVSNASILDF